MRIQPNLIDGSIARAARGHLDPPKVEAALGLMSQEGLLATPRS